MSKLCYEVGKEIFQTVKTVNIQKPKKQYFHKSCVMAHDTLKDIKRDANGEIYSKQKTNLPHTNMAPSN